MVLLVDVIDINRSLLKRDNQIAIATCKHDEALELIETTQFNLILIDLTTSHSDTIARIKTPLGINSETPIIAVANQADVNQIKEQYPLEFDDWLISPITEDRLNETIELWQTKASALDYLQTILSKTNNNRNLAFTILDKLFEELPSQINAIKEALENQRYAQAQEVTHKLHGSASFCGLVDIQQAANTLESNLVHNNYTDINQHFLSLQLRTLDFTRCQKLILEQR